MAHQHYFSNSEQSQPLGGVKMGDPQEKPPDNPQAKPGLSQVWHKLG